MKDYFQAMYFDFLNFSDRFTSTKMPDQWTIVKICINKTIYNLLFFQVFPIYFRSSKAFNCIAALKHNLICVAQIGGCDQLLYQLVLQI